MIRYAEQWTRRHTKIAMLIAPILGTIWSLYECITGVKMAIRGAQSQITTTVQTWPKVVVAPHRFGGVEYQLGTREIGHIHGDSLVDIPFPRAIRNQLVEAGLAQPHHILPESGWISFYIRTQADVSQAIDLLHQSYAIAQAQSARRHSQGNSQAEADHDTE